MAARTSPKSVSAVLLHDAAEHPDQWKVHLFWPAGPESFRFFPTEADALSFLGRYHIRLVGHVVLN